MWSDPETRRNFFEKYAKNNDFNPLLPANWYSQSKAQIMAIQVWFETHEMVRREERGERREGRGEEKRGRRGERGGGLNNITGS